MANARMTQEYVEVLATGDSKARQTQQYLEILATGDANARQTQIYVETLAFALSTGRITQIYSEVLTNAGSQTYEETLSDSVTLSESISASNGVLSDTVTLSDDVSLNIVSGQILSDTLTLTELVNTVQFGELDETLTFSETIDGVAYKIGSWTDTLTMTEDLLQNMVHNRIIGDAIDLAESWQKNISQLLAFSDTFGFVDDLDGIAVKVFGDTVTFSDALSYFIAKLIQDDIEFGDTMVPAGVFKRSMTDQLVPYDSLALQIFSRLTASDTLVFTDTMIGAATRPLDEDPIVFSDYILGARSTPLNDTLAFTETPSYLRVITKSLSDALTLTDLVSPHLVLTRQLVETLALVETYLGIRVKFGTLDDTLTFTDELHREVHAEILDTPLTLSDTITLQKLGNRTVDETVDLTESLTTVNTLVRSVTDTIISTDGFIVKITRGPNSSGTGIDEITQIPGSDPPIYEGVVDVLPQVVMVGQSLSIVLPPPEFNDFIAGQGKIAVSRSMTGRFRVYAKRTAREKLNWRFVLPKYKADELKTFMLTEIDSPLKVVDWEGTHWDLKFLSDSVDFTESGRWAPCGNKVEVTLELVGSKYA